MFKIAVTIQSDTRYLTPLRDMVKASAKLLGEKRFPSRAQKAISLSLIEAVDNAIFHAHRRRKVLPIDVVLAIDRRIIRVDVGDLGKGLDHPQSDRPSVKSTHGRGLFLMKSMMNRVESQKKGKKHWIRMTYYL